MYGGDRMTELITKEDGLYLTMGEDHEVKVLKGWESFSGWYWFATELNKDGFHFGYVQGICPEWGSFHEDELKSHPLVWEIKEIDLPYSGRRD
tara:strand:+ start:206 stop:484 length:279 start_codon:yes stop_codon:yes gene_type:complete